MGVMELGWIDFSEDARKKTLTVLASLQEPGAIDELGIGIVRDGFAERLFPGTSTLHTRAKYFFLVPYALKDMERSDNTKKTPRALSREYDKTEESIAKRLIVNTNEPIGKGIIGARSLHTDLSGNWVKRGPAVMYWNALSTLGFLRNERMSMGGYFAAIAGTSPLKQTEVSPDDEANGWNDDQTARQTLWHVPTGDYARWSVGEAEDSIKLTEGEARFFATQVRMKCAGSLYQAVVDDADLCDALLGLTGQASKEDGGAARFERSRMPFQDLFRVARDRISPDLALLCRHAATFSDFVYLCRIRYNAQLPALEEVANDAWEDAESYMHEWASALDVGWIYEHLDLFGRGGAYPLRAFLSEAKADMLAGDVASLDECIRRREREIKRERAKIGREGGSIETWRGGTWLTYRSEVAARMLADVREAGGLDA